MYRKSFENDLAIMVQTSNEYFDGTLLSLDREEQIRNAILVDIFCETFNKVSKHNFYELYEKGNSVSCERSSHNFVVHFHLNKAQFQNSFNDFLNSFVTFKETLE